jgi:hypothetical protein
VSRTGPPDGPPAGPGPRSQWMGPCAAEAPAALRRAAAARPPSPGGRNGQGRLPEVPTGGPDSTGAGGGPDLSAGAPDRSAGARLDGFGSFAEVLELVLAIMFKWLGRPGFFLDIALFQRLYYIIYTKIFLLKIVDKYTEATLEF